MKYFILLFLCGLSMTAFSQVKIGDNTDTIDPASILELESSNSGLLISRLTTSQIAAISNPPVGLLVFNKDINLLQMNTGTTSAPVWSSLSKQVGGQTGAIQLPVGTDAQRPASPVEGMLRYNTTKSQFEVYKNSAWVAL